MEKARIFALLGAILLIGIVISIASQSYAIFEPKQEQAIQPAVCKNVDGQPCNGNCDGNCPGNCDCKQAGKTCGCKDGNSCVLPNGEKCEGRCKGSCQGNCGPNSQMNAPKTCGCGK